MPRGRGNSRKLTIFLIKDNILNFQEALKDPSSLTRIPLVDGLDFTGELYIEASHPHPPTWLRFIEPHLSPVASLDRFKSASVAAVLFVKLDERIYALTFSYGRSLLKPNSYVLDFGLRTVLNKVDHKQLRSIDTKTYEDLVVSTKKQTSRSSEIATFGLDVARDLLRCVVGKPRDEDFANLLAGSDSLTIQAEVKFDELGDKCEDCYAAYNGREYQEHFPWIDHFEEVRDPAIRDELDSLLVASLVENQPGGPYLAPTKIVDWENIEKFGFTGRHNNLEFCDLDIHYYLIDVLGDKRRELTLEKIKQHQVCVKYSDSGEMVDEWSIYSCLVWEVEHRSELYALMDERWFKISRNFASEVSAEISQIPEPCRILPSAGVDEWEGDYNERVGQAEDLICLDQKLVRTTAGTSQIEICDLFSIQKQLIHVKRKSRSATLSHLFSQGVVSALELLEDTAVRKKTKEYLQTKRGFGPLMMANGINPSEFEIAYVIIVKNRVHNRSQIPFFSKVNLMQQAKTLRRWGFKVALQIVEEDAALAHIIARKSVPQREHSLG